MDHRTLASVSVKAVSPHSVLIKAVRLTLIN